MNLTAITRRGIAQTPGFGSRKWHDSFDFFFPIVLPGITALERLIGRARSESEEAVFVELSRRLTLRFRLTRLAGVDHFFRISFILPLAPPALISFHGPSN